MHDCSGWYWYRYHQVRLEDRTSNLSQKIKKTPPSFFINLDYQNTYRKNKMSSSENEEDEVSTGTGTDTTNSGVSVVPDDRGGVGWIKISNAMVQMFISGKCVLLSQLVSPCCPTILTSTTWAIYK